MNEVQVEEVCDTVHLFNRFRIFYGKTEAAKCTSCNTYHLFSQ